MLRTRPLCMYVIGMPFWVCFIMSYRRGLFALFILFPGNARSLLTGCMRRKLPRFLYMPILNLKSTAGFWESLRPYPYSR